MAKIREEEGNVNEAAELLQELQVSELYRKKIVQLNFLMHYFVGFFQNPIIPKGGNIRLNGTPRKNRIYSGANAFELVTQGYHPNSNCVEEN